MGNWRSVEIVGTCNSADIPALRKALTSGRDFENFHCLVCTGGLGGLPMWAAESIDAVGNLAERDYTVQAVADQLVELAKVAPTLQVKVHCGGDYEDKKCIVTVTLADGVATVGDPEIETVREVDARQFNKNFLSALFRNTLD